MKHSLFFGIETKNKSDLTGVVVQLVRIPACHAGGRGFEPRPLRQTKKLLILVITLS